MSILSQFSSSYDAAKAPDRSEVPDGKYIVRVDRLEIKKTKEHGLPMMAWELVIVSGPQAKRRLFKNNVIKENTIQYLKQDLILAGFNGKLEELETQDGLAQFLDRHLEVTLKTKGESNNIYFNKLLTDAEREKHSGTPF
jgi:hypothetical protein